MRRPLVALLVVLSACAAPQVPAPKPPAGAEARAPQAGPLRLPDGVRPTAYTLHLTLDPAQPTFTGEVEVALELARASEELWLHGQGLTVKKAELVQGSDVLALQVRPVAERFLVFRPPRPVGPGQATLRIAYQGALSSRELAGLFRVQDGGDWYAFTQFEPLGARRAFPCFDEPGFKVPWSLSLSVPEALEAAANAPVAERGPGAAPGLARVRFQTTPPLPSYLVALAVGPFEAREARPSGQKGVPTRVLAPRGRAAEAAYAAEVTPPILAWLEDYFGRPYPYEKLDVVAVPLFGGAMENPGLVTFNQQLVLARPEEDSAQRQRRFAHVQAHELAHQWFGDLVTMQWWDDLWLNEAFATWTASRMVEAWKPGWGEGLARVADRSDALRADALVSARRIRQPIETESDIFSAFDGITYGKGAAVLAMTEAWLGREAFQRGVRGYLEKHAFGNATARDFLAALSEAAPGKDVASVLGTFLEQGGAPLVDARAVCEPGGAPKVRLTQRRFLPVGSQGAPQGQTWRVPLCVRYGDARGPRTQCTVLEGAEAELALEGARGCPEWLWPNADGAGYFRALVPPEALGGLLRRGGPLTDAERVAVLGDVEALVRAGELPAGDALALLPRLAQEPVRGVLEASLGVLDVLDEDLVPRARAQQRERFLRQTYSARARQVGWTPRPNEAEDARLLRPRLLRVAALEGQDGQLLREARALARRWLGGDKKALAPEVVELALSTAVASGDVELQDKLLEAARATQDRRERGQLLGALAAAQDPKRVEAQLDLVLSGTLDVREAMTLVRGAASDPDTRGVALAWVEKSWDALAAKLPEERVGSLPALFASACDAETRAEVARFFGPRVGQRPGGARALAQTLERIDLCAALARAQQPSLEAFLELSQR